MRIQQLTLSLSLCVSLACVGTAADMVPQRQPDFMPIGLYWAGEFVYWNDATNQIDWPKVDVALADMAQRSVNALWMTHLSPTDTAEMARRAATHHIYLVASVADLDFSEPTVRALNDQDQQNLIQRVVQAWGDAPKPIAWGLGDEPRTAYMSEMASYVQKWRTFAPGEPVTTVVMYHDLDAAAALSFDALSADIYPFFSAGNPNRYAGPDYQAWTGNSRRLAAVSPKPWMMGQSYQEPWGPYEIDPAGNIVYLPGGAPHWIFPTPAQISWQALSAFATGSKGMFYFHYRHPTSSDPNAAATNLPAAVQTATNSGAPRAMVYEDGRPTPQYDAMAEAFSWIAKRKSILAPLKESAVPEAWEVEPAAIGGNVVSMLVDPATQKRWLMVVASWNQPASAPVRFRVGPHILGLEAAADGTERASLTVAGSFRTGEVLLAPGTAALFSCSVTASTANTVPTISSVANQTITEDAATGALVVTVGDAETAVGSLTLTATAADTTLLPASGITVGGTGANRTVTLTPAANRNGSTVITLTVSDGTTTAIRTFTLTVTAVNDPPTNTVAPTMGGFPVLNTALTATSGTWNDTLDGGTAISYAYAWSRATSAAGAGATAIATTQSYTPVAGDVGAYLRVTVTATDSGAPGTTSAVASSAWILATATANTAPTISTVASQTITENAATAALAVTVGDAETAASALTLTAVATDTTLLPASGITVGGTGANRTVTLTPAANRNGSTEITLTVSDGTITATRTFTLTVTAVNDGAAPAPTPTTPTTPTTSSGSKGCGLGGAVGILLTGAFVLIAGSRRRYR